VPVPNSGFVAIAAGSMHSLGLKSDGSIIAWGWNDYRQCDVPEPNRGFVTVDGGSHHSVGVKGTAGGIAEGKRLPDGRLVSIEDAVVTAAWDDVLYIEEDNRTSGIRVEKAGHGVSVGTRVTATGVVKTNPNGERYIAAGSLLQGAAGEVEPLALTNTGLGGGDMDYDSGPPACGQQGVADGSGVNNIGLLIKTWGEVAAAGADCFTISDGSSANVKCVVPTGVTLPTVGDYVSVAGISSCEKTGEELQRVVLIRTQDDILAF